jgi:hypothetical protein
MPNTLKLIAKDNCVQEITVRMAKFVYTDGSTFLNRVITFKKFVELIDTQAFSMTPGSA